MEQTGVEQYAFLFSSTFLAWLIRDSVAALSLSYELRGQPAIAITTGSQRSEESIARRRP